jgi:hypothetical protein
MAVYVDSMNRAYGRMSMNHMLADTTEELLDMADKIGVDRKHIQAAGTYREHFDICKSKREAAFRYGAIPVSAHDIGMMLTARRLRLRAPRP